MARILTLWSGCVAMLPLPLKPNVAAPGATWWRFPVRFRLRARACALAGV
jgi:hypothetical protein